MRCAIYARVSTVRQAEQNISIPDQIRRVRHYAEAKDMDVGAEFVELGMSARNDRRPEFQAMIDEACKTPKPFDVILVHSFSRFFRDEVHFELYRRQLENHGVAVISITQEMSDGPGGEFTRRIIALTDEMRSKEDAKHVKRGMIENARQGFWNGASAPFGYKAVAAEKRGDKIKKKLAPDPQMAEMVKLIFTLFLTGDGKSGPLGIKNIAVWLNTRGHKTPRNGAYYTSRVHAILTNETYIGTAWYNRTNTATGEKRPRSEWVKVSVPVIIAQSTFQRVQMLLHARRPSITPPRLSNSKVLLSGLARCEGCGKSMMMVTGKGGAYRYYKCSAKCLKGRCEGDVAMTIREEKLDKFIMEALTQKLLTPKRTRSIVAAIAKRREDGRSETSHGLNQLRGQLSQATRRTRNLLAALADGIAGDTALFQEALTKAETERAELISLITVQEAQVKQALKPISAEEAKTASTKLKQLITEAPADLKKRYIRAFVSDIVVGKSEIKISGSKDALAEAMSGEPLAHLAAAQGPVRSFEREWCTQQDSNL
ncbi:MAG: recombinase family protein [Robiginitomaculum sp.]|nr:MAG: recombinase family protein [Robiginitomaculum sp.]